MSTSAWHHIKQFAKPHSPDLNTRIFPHYGLWIAMFVFALIHPLWLASSSIQIDYQDTWMTTLFGGWLQFLGVRYRERGFQLLALWRSQVPISC